MLAVGIGPIGPFEMIAILVIVVIIFGVGRLPEVGGAVGKSIREFRRASKEPDPDESAQSNGADTPVVSQTAQPTCTKCGAQINAETKFCAECGTPTQAPVN